MALLLVAVAVTGATIGMQYVHALPHGGHTHHGASKAMTSSAGGSSSSSSSGSSSGGSYY
jgi:hypothetical protein